MSNWLKRFWAIVLTAILLFTAFPAVVGAQGPDDGEQDEPRVFSQADDQLLEDDVFAKIEAVTATTCAPKRARCSACRPARFCRTKGSAGRIQQTPPKKDRTL